MNFYKLRVFKPIQLSNKTQFDGRCHCAVSSHNTSNDNDETWDLHYNLAVVHSSDVGRWQQQQQHNSQAADESYSLHGKRQLKNPAGKLLRHAGQAVTNESVGQVLQGFKSWTDQQFKSKNSSKCKVVSALSTISLSLALSSNRLLVTYNCLEVRCSVLK